MSTLSKQSLHNGGYNGQPCLGAFHVFHISCLIHWVLFCEFELWVERAMNARGSRRRRGKAAAKNLQFSSIFCSECYGTGIVLEGNDLENLELALAERDTIVEIFYEKHLDQLIDVITSSCPPRNSSYAT
ncbi:hypothetical protein KSP39_PZI010626 [Platanthera zijinensis]|uniref:Uncharacterized protein n=1 Tax=Platanthera zijinensis TaxID=2320716 RepID=A0AAP0BIZ0_9ASPA